MRDRHANILNMYLPEKFTVDAAMKMSVQNGIKIAKKMHLLLVLEQQQQKNAT